MTNLHLGLGQLLIGVLTKIPLLGVYHLVYLWAHSQGVPTWDMSVWVLDRLCYYGLRLLLVPSLKS